MPKVSESIRYEIQRQNWLHTVVGTQTIRCRI